MCFCVYTFLYTIWKVKFLKRKYKIILFRKKRILKRKVLVKMNQLCKIIVFIM